MSYRFQLSTLFAAAVLLPAAAFADINGTVTLSAGSTFSLDQGATVTSGGDMTYTGTSITFGGTAKGGVIPGITGASGFAEINLAELQALAALATTTPIPASSLPVGTVFAVETNGGNGAKLLVTSISSSSIGLQYYTYGATGGTGGTTGGPTVTAIQNNYSYLVSGLPNYGIAPGALFIIKGTGMATPGVTAVLQSSASPGIPSTLNGASLSVTVNGTTTHPGIYYAIPTQIAAVLPSGTPAGTGTLTVSYGGQTATASIQVVQSALGLDTYYGEGTGLGVATSPTTGALYNYNNSAAPGNTIVLWGSGLGADTADSDTVFTSTPHAVSVPLTIYIGGIQATIGYQGSSGYPGVNQINVTIPSSVQPGCYVGVVAVSGTVVSNTVTLPVNPGGGTCSDPTLGITGNQILTLGGQTNYNYGYLAILQEVSSGQTTNFAAGSFVSEQGAQQASGYGQVSVGNCIVEGTLTGAATPYTTTGLDAGTITVTGPNGTVTLTTVPQSPGTYYSALSNTFIPGTGGSFTFTGTGGANVGAFTTSISYTNPLSWTNQNSITAVNRAQGATVTWSGGASNSYVIVTGSSGGNGVVGSFTCYAPVGAGTFTVPSYVLLAMPVGTGTLMLENSTAPVSFSATGLNYAFGIAAFTSTINPSYQ